MFPSFSYWSKNVRSVLVKFFELLYKGNLPRLSLWTQKRVTTLGFWFLETFKARSWLIHNSSYCITFWELILNTTLWLRRRGSEWDPCSGEGDLRRDPRSGATAWNLVSDSTLQTWDSMDYNMNFVVHTRYPTVNSWIWKEDSRYTRDKVRSYLWKPRYIRLRLMNLGFHS